MIASWTALSTDHEESYGQRLPSIFKAINELRMAIGEKFTSADLDISVFECDTTYDPAKMDDAYGRQSSAKRAPEAIVGTTGIGLGKVIAERTAKDVLQIIIPAKIVLWSTLSEVREKGLFGAQDLLTKADTLSISEVGEKVTTLNEEIFQAAATLGEALIHKRHEVSQTELEVAAAVSREMVGEKLMKLLITQSQKPDPEVNPLLVQVTLQIFMVKFCVSKIQSWYPGDSAVGGFLSAIYSEIRSTGKLCIDLKTKFCLTYNIF